MMKTIGLATAVALVFSLGTPTQAAGTRDNVYAAFARCNQFQDNRQWLNCIYGAAQPMRGELGLPPAPDSQIRMVPAEGNVQGANQPSIQPATPAPPRSRTGFFSYLLGGNSVIESAKLKSYNFDRSGHFLAILSNGEIWQQVADDKVLASWRRSPDQYIISIQTGALGSYTLTVDGEDQAYKVQPVH